MNDPVVYYLAWLVYMLAGAAFYTIVWKLTQPARHRLLVFCLRGVLLALMATPWFTAIEGRAIAPALMVVMMDAITISGSAAVRAFVPLFLATVIALIASVVLYFVRRKAQSPGDRQVG
jgi:hypothetical protein